MRTRLIVSIIVGALVITGLLFFKDKANLRNLLNPLPENISSDTRLRQFVSEEGFKEYLAEGQQNKGYDNFFAFGTANLRESSDSISSARYSETNVQVKGIDEPDIVKTNGQKIYYSNGLWNIYPLTEPAVRDFPVSSSIEPDRAIFPSEPEFNGETQILNANPLTSESTIDLGGELLISGNTLISIQSNKLTGFDVSDSKNPKEIWVSDLDNSGVAASRMKNGKLYVVAQSFVNVASPCPIPLIKSSGQVALSIECRDIYHPTVNTGVDSTYTVMEMNPATGEVIKKISFVGSSGQSIVYVSENNIYITYSYPGDYVNFFYGFLAERGGDLVPGSVLTKFSNLRSYDISTSSKIQEIQVILNQHTATLSADDKLKFNTELENRMTDYAKTRGRELENTGIIKVNLENMNIASTGGVPGHPLNQFSLDEYQGNLRIATTSSGSFLVNTESTNDLYVLNGDLKLSGSILDLGVGERIFSARFINDKAYLVTFKQIDPFYVLDLSNPSDPKKSGELKIPGFSSYLHPLSQNMILGIGQEEGNVKVSLFDVSNPESPAEISKYSLNEFWTEVQSNHHAFLHDQDNQIFFIPGGNGGYIFSYKNNEITLTKAINKPGVKRAVYIGNSLYVFSESSVSVYDENTWAQTANLNF